MSYAEQPRLARVRVPGSTSNLGAGFDCLGLALDRYLTAEYEPAEGTLQLERGGTLTALRCDVDDDLLVRAFRARLARFGVGCPGGVIRVESEIPVSRGLGSSGAAVVAGVVLADAVLGRVAEPEGVGDGVEWGAPDDGAAAAGWLEEALVYEGHPDNVSPCIYGGLVGVAREEGRAARVMRLPLSAELGFAYAAPPTFISTQAARSILPPQVDFGVAVRGIARMTALLQGLASGDPELLRIGFTDELHVPYRLQLIPGAERVFAAALEAGAAAITISGSGSGLIAVAARGVIEEVAEAMTEAFRRVVGSEGVVGFSASPDLQGVVVARTGAVAAVER